jgi:iron complex transport system ATP-binding protein
MTPVLSARGVRAGYGHAEVVRGVDLELRAGELCVVLGPNGAGKSTLLRALSGLIPLRGGEVQLLGRPLHAWPRRELARKVGWVPQASDPIEGFSGLELVVMGRSPHLGLWGLPGTVDVSRARAVLEELGIAALGPRPASEVSGGERRLLLLARAFAQEPTLLVLDEPTAFLDLRHQVQCLERVRARVQAGLAAVAVLHDVNLAAAFADRVVLLGDGVVQEQGARGEVLRTDALERLYGLPMASGEAAGQQVFAPRRGA